jgi:hypothetical protein
MAAVRDHLRILLEKNLVVEMKDHSTLDGAVIKILDQKLDNVVDLIIDIFEDYSKSLKDSVNL